MKIYVASHTFLDMPSQIQHLHGLYQPLFVGASRIPTSQRTEGWLYDDSYEGSLSAKNDTFCELTGLHWIWKNSEEDVVGLVHYRRFLANEHAGETAPAPLDEGGIEDALSSHDCIIARPENLSSHLQPLSVAQHYRLFHCSTDLLLTRDIVKRLHPAYLEAFNEVMMQTTFSPFNIIICRKRLFDRYAAWLFSILDELETRIDPYRDRDGYQKRVFGFIAERLLNVYIKHEGLNALGLDILDDTGEVLFPGEPTAQPACHRTPFATSTRNANRAVRRFRPIFDYAFYCEHYGDIAEVFSQNPDGALGHFLTCGLNEGRTAHPCFSITSYENGNPALRARFKGDRAGLARHYLRNPFDRRHAIGYENLFDDGEDPSRRSMGLARSLDQLKRDRYQRRAEKGPVID